jgi:hypothetical protein
LPWSSKGNGKFAFISFYVVKVERREDLASYRRNFCVGNCENKQNLWANIFFFFFTCSHYSSIHQTLFYRKTNFVCVLFFLFLVSKHDGRQCGTNKKEKVSKGTKEKKPLSLQQNQINHKNFFSVFW